MLRTLGVKFPSLNTSSSETLACKIGSLGYRLQAFDSNLFCFPEELRLLLNEIEFECSTAFQSNTLLSFPREQCLINTSDKPMMELRGVSLSCDIALVSNF